MIKIKKERIRLKGATFITTKDYSVYSVVNVNTALGNQRRI